MASRTTFHVAIEPPYTEIADDGYTYIHPKSNRRHIVLRKRIDGVLTNVRNMLYSRYIFQVDYWKKTGKMIPDGYDVDHINDDKTDDRLDNLQLLTKVENIRKRDIEKYRNNLGVNDRIIAEIRQCIADGIPRYGIATRLGLPVGYIRYIIYTYIPEYKTEWFVERDISDIVRRVNAGEKQDIIADDYGVDQATISRLMKEHLGNTFYNVRSSDRVQFIRDKVAQGWTLNQISKALGVVEGSVLYHIKKSCPDVWEKMRENYDLSQGRSPEITEEVLRVCREELAKGSTITAASRILGRSDAFIRGILKQHAPELVPPPQKSSPRMSQETKEQILRDKENGMSVPMIAKKHNVSSGSLNQMFHRLRKQYAV